MNGFDAGRYPRLVAIVDGNVDAGGTLTDKVRDEILRQIITNKLPAGSPLTTTGVAEMTGVSRTPAAKALSELAADGILEQPNNQHAIVSTNAATWLDQCRALRNLVEPEAAFSAAGRLPPLVLGDLWALSREALPSDVYDWTPAAVFFDAGLHLSIAEHCGNLPMKVAIRRCWTYKRLAYHIYHPSRDSLEPEYYQHVEILKALAAGDGEAAWKAMVKHLRASWRVKQAKDMLASEDVAGSKREQA
jgi:DNA-binding GntR family transcriptional regulator